MALLVFHSSNSSQAMQNYPEKEVNIDDSNTQTGKDVRV